MNKKTDSLFASPFYINAEYAQSLLPSLYQNLVLGKSSDKSESDLQKEAFSIKLDSGRKNTELTSVVVISIKQPIQKFTDWYNLGSKSFMAIMSNYANDPSVAAIVLDIDSGGGQVYGTAEFYDFIKAYPKPTVAFTDGYLCSAAYYLAAACDYIIANKRADHIGSIGAYATIVDFSGIMEKFGGKVHEIYATESTEKNSDFREVMKGNYLPYIKNVLDPIVATFHFDMKATRPQLDPKVFKGGTWNGEQSLALGLIDENGTLSTAIAKGYEFADKNSNQNLNTDMTKSRPLVEAVLGLTAPLASTENGSYLNDDQLDQFENDLAERDAKVTKLNADVKTEQDAKTALTDQLTASQASLTGVETEVDAMMTNAGLTPSGTLNEKLTALSAKVEVMGKGDGATPTNVRVDASAPKTNAFVDANAGHNQLANELFK